MWARWIDGAVQGDREFLKVAGLDPDTRFEDPHAFVELIQALLDEDRPLSSSTSRPGHRRASRTSMTLSTTRPHEPRERRRRRCGRSGQVLNDQHRHGVTVQVLV